MRNRFMDMFGLSVPILQAPIGSALDEALVTAVAQGGGMGSIAMTWTEPDKGLASAASLRACNIPYFFNFVLRFGTSYPSRYVGAGLPAVTLSWGIDPDLIARFKSGGTKVGVQVGSAAGARVAIAAGADFVIVQGIEAGGHVQSSTPLARLLDETVAIAGATPVIAAGGLATGADIAIWDPEVERIMRQRDLHHGADYTRYEGLRVKGWPVRVLLAGKTAVQRDEMSSPTPLGEYLSRDRSSLCFHGQAAR